MPAALRLCNLPNPTLTFGFVLATFFGAGFHLIYGGGARRLALFLLAGWLGFALGHIVGVLFDVNTFNIGTIRFFAASAGAILLLYVTHLLSKA